MDGKVKYMENEKKQLRLWQGLLVIILAGLEVFVFSDFLPQWLGMGRSLIGELILLGTAVGAVAVFGGKFRSVFPIHKPKLTEVMGTILIYLGASQAISVVTMIEMYIAPEMVTETSIGLSSMFTSSSMIVAIIVVGIAPAICEEAVFRGVFFNSIWNQTHGKWVPIIVTAAVFGLFHGSIIRFFPTFLLGIVLGYLVYETNNMFYNVMFHAINNIIPVLALYGMQFLMQLMARELGMNGSGMWNFVMDTATSQVSQLSPAFMGIYMIDGGVGLAILYLGNHVLHLGREGYPKELFPKEKRKQQFIWLALALALAVTGGMMIVAGTIQGLHF
ncbi:MAG: type II CAAX prenyl endopeptidase Rce1 family protein [Dorea sp.]